MTQLELFEDRTYRRGMSRFGFVRALRYWIASWQARTALARLVRDRSRYRIEDIPPHLRRDLGFPEPDPAPWRTTFIILVFLRLK
jgi:hypothetical protein